MSIGIARVRLSDFMICAAAFVVMCMFRAEAGACSVREFGAKGDGVTKDTATVQAAAIPGRKIC